eukprot:3545315-Pleurochrysis_carterae.AAC.1
MELCRAERNLTQLKCSGRCSDIFSQTGYNLAKSAIINLCDTVVFHSSLYKLRSGIRTNPMGLRPLVRIIVRSERPVCPCSSEAGSRDLAIRPSAS